jgi:hypothetical protein
VILTLADSRVISGKRGITKGPALSSSPYGSQTFESIITRPESNKEKKEAETVGLREFIDYKTSIITDEDPLLGSWFY